MGRHSTARRRTGRFAVLVGAAVLVAGGITAATLYDGGSGPRSDPRPSTPTSRAACTTRLRAVVASSFAPVLRAVVPSIAQGRACASVQLTVADGTAAAGLVSRDRPDVWIPDDPSWLTFTTGYADSAAAPDIVATSPLMFLTRGVALPAAARTWAGLGTAVARHRPWRLVLRDPTSGGDGLVSATVLATALFNRSGMLASALDLLRAEQAGRTTPGLPTPNAGEVAIVPGYAVRRLPAGLRVTAPTDSTAVLRYSWTPAAHPAPATAAALRRLRAAITATTVQAAGLEPTIPPRAFPPLTEHFIRHVLTTYVPSERRANLLVVVDVSGSMAAPPPGSRTPMFDLVRTGVTQLAALLPDSAHLGLWRFGADLDRPRDYEVLVNSGRLDSAQRARIGAATGQLTALHTGTGLYDTIMAAYRAQQANYQPGLPNQVLVFTDGLDEDDPNAISLATLRSELAQVSPHHRVDLEVLAFGQRAQIGALQHALDSVDGYVQPLTSADDVLGAFVHAMAEDDRSD